MSVKSLALAAQMSRRERKPVIRDEPTPEPKVKPKKQQSYEVEKIVAHKIIKGSIFYLVKWVGWDDADNTWEPEENLLRCPLVVSEYMLNIPETVTAMPEDTQ